MYTVGFILAFKDQNASQLELIFLFQGVRDLLKALLDKIQTIPTTVSSSIVQQLLAAREVFSSCSVVSVNFDMIY